MFLRGQGLVCLQWIFGEMGVGAGETFQRL